MTHINSFDYDGEYLTWATNGFAGYIKVIIGKFSINGDRGLLIPKMEGLNLKVIKEMLQPIFRNLAKGRKGENGEDEFTKVYPSMIENIEINLPITSDGNIDINSLKIIEEEINTVNEIKSKISAYKKQIEELNVEIVSNYLTNEFTINSIFNIEKGKAKYTNQFITTNQGSYPLFSSQTTNEGIIGLINCYDFDCDALTWTTDGIYAGTVFLRKGKFSMTTHCGALIVKNKIKNLHIDFVYSYLKENLRNYAIGEQNKRVTTNIIKNIQIPIPINSKGEFDLDAQKEIAEKYRKIEQIKKSISAELDKITTVEIDYE